MKYVFWQILNKEAKNHMTTEGAEHLVSMREKQRRDQGNGAGGLLRAVGTAMVMVLLLCGCGAGVTSVQAPQGESQTKPTPTPSPPVAETSAERIQRICQNFSQILRENQANCDTVAQASSILLQSELEFLKQEAPSILMSDGNVQAICKELNAQVLAEPGVQTCVTHHQGVRNNLLRYAFAFSGEDPPPPPPPLPQITVQDVFDPALPPPISFSLNEEIPAVVAVFDGPPPTIKTQRAQIKAAQQRIEQSGKAPLTGIIIRHMPNYERAAISLWNADLGRFQVAIGNINHLLSDPEEFAIAATISATSFSKFSQIEHFLCEGSALNTSVQSLNVSILCSITIEKENLFTGKPELTTIARGRHDLGEVKPGKRVKFRYKVIPDQAYMTTNLTRYSFVGEILIDGLPALFLNESRYASDIEWFAIIDQLNKDGFTLTNDQSHSYSFEVPDRFVALKTNAQDKEAKKIWDLLRKHQKAHTKDIHLGVSFHRNNRVIIDVSNGKIARPLADKTTQ